MKLCPKCNITHEKHGTFCSRACANSRGPRTEDFKEKLRSKIRGRASPFKGKHKVVRIFVNCLICQKEVAIKMSDSIRTTCKSIQCKIDLCKSAGKSSASKRKVRSKQEIELFDLCRSAFKNVSSNSVIVDGWDADIVLHDERIAILWNGPWHYRDMKMKNHSLAQVQMRDKIKTEKFVAAGWKVLIFEDRQYTPQQAFEVVGLVGIEPT